MIFIGIDPGLTGAVAAIWNDDIQAYARTWDAPTARDGRHRVLLPVEMKISLLEATQFDVLGAGTPIVFIEKVHSMPKQGVSSSFNFGEGYGIWQGLIVGLGLRFEKVTPQRWQKEMLAGMQGGKEASIIRAQELFPEAELHLKKHHGRAEALLIAEYGRRTYGGGP